MRQPDTVKARSAVCRKCQGLCIIDTREDISPDHFRMESQGKQSVPRKQAARPIPRAAKPFFFSSYLAANLLFYYDFVRVETGEELWVPLAGEGKEAPLPVLASGLQLNGADGIWYALTAVSILAFAGCVVFILRDRQKQ